MSYIDISAESFSSQVLEEKDTPVLVDFWAPWCQPCMMLSPIIEEIADELDGKVKVCKINCDENSEFIMDKGVVSIPCLVLYVDGEEKGRLVGFNMKEDIISFIEENK